MKLLLIALVFAVGAPAPPQAPSSAAPAAVPAVISRLAWLAGAWRGTQGSATIEEHWTPPAGGSMLAVARTISGDRLRAFEFLRIVEKGSTLVYLAMPNGRSPATEFTLTRISGDSVTFENPAHDFPKMIRYTLEADGTLEAVVSGTGGQKPQTFRFTKR